MILRARCILPLGSPPIDNGAVVIAEGRIQWLGRWRDCPPAAGQGRMDLGEVALLPGLINAHSHLDYTGMAGQIPPPKYFPDWIKTILSFKAHWSFSEYAASWLAGAKMLLDHGTTMTADIESVPELLPEVWPATPLRVISFLEMTGVKSRKPGAEILRETLDQIDALPKITGKEAALSPHALYSTNRDLLDAIAKAAPERNFLVSMHLAESDSEFLMFREARGPFFDWLKGQRDMSDCAGRSPLQLADSYGLLNPRFLAVHVNYLAPGDAERLARAGASVVHCPASHDYFQHQPFPYSELARAGVNVCLGTDSLASTRKSGSAAPELNLWREMRLFASANPGVAPSAILRLSTVNAARALGRASEAGSLQTGAFADFVTLSYTGSISEAAVCEELLYTGETRDVFIAGVPVRTV